MTSLKPLTHLKRSMKFKWITTKSGRALGIALILMNLSASAQTVESALATSKAELQSALQQLAEIETSIAEEKIPLASETFQVEKQLRETRREWEGLQAFQRNQAIELDRLEASVETSADQLKYREGLLQEFLRAWEMRLHPAEWDLYPQALEPLDRVVDWEKLPSQVQSESQTEKEDSIRSALATLDSLETAITRLESSVGGNTTEFEAVDEAGRATPGKAIWIGPQSFFIPDTDTAPAGILMREPGAAKSRIFPIPGEESAIRNWALNGNGEIPLDVTGGRAVEVSANTVNLVEHLKQGGIIMVPLLTLALVALGIALWKGIEISRVGAIQPRQLNAALDEIANQRPEEALKIARQFTGPASDLLQLAITKIQLSRALLEELLFERILQQKPRLERGLAFLAVTAATAPLLGLLGTVIGMIRTFQLITLFGTGDAKSLSGGISEALITTEIGLVVAIPALILHAILSRRIKRALGEMEQTATAFLNGRDLLLEEGKSISGKIKPLRPSSEI